jgi:hypothetical protein
MIQSNKPRWYQYLDSRDCECDVDEFAVKRSETAVGYSDSLIEYMKLECPECGECFARADMLVEG